MRRGRLAQRRLRWTPSPSLRVGCAAGRCRRERTFAANAHVMGVGWGCGHCTLLHRATQFPGKAEGRALYYPPPPRVLSLQIVGPSPRQPPPYAPTQRAPLCAPPDTLAARALPTGRAGGFLQDQEDCEAGQGAHAAAAAAVAWEWGDPAGLGRSRGGRARAFATACGGRVRAWHCPAILQIHRTAWRCQWRGSGVARCRGEVASGRRGPYADSCEHPPHAGRMSPAPARR